MRESLVSYLLLLILIFATGCTTTYWDSPRIVEGDEVVDGTRVLGEGYALLAPGFYGSLSVTSILLLSIDRTPINERSPGLLGSPPKVVAVRPGRRLIKFKAGSDFQTMREYELMVQLEAGKKYSIGYECRYGDGVVRDISPGYTNWEKGKIISSYPSTSAPDCLKPRYWIEEVKG